MLPYASLDEARTRLVMRDDWASRWTAAWQINGSEVVWPVRDLGSVPVLSSRPVRGFTWRTKQKHRPGLEFLVSTGRKHGFESLEERAALLALDFMTVIEVLPQPFALTFEHVDGHAGHIPDFLAVMGDGGHWLLDIRPAGLVGEMDAVKFAASREAAAACGWRCSPTPLCSPNSPNSPRTSASTSWRSWPGSPPPSPKPPAPSPRSSPVPAPTRADLTLRNLPDLPDPWEMICEDLGDWGQKSPDRL